MSQSATLYRISKNNFTKLKESLGESNFDSASARSYAVFQGSFMALEYLLLKNQDVSKIGLVHKIFKPGQNLLNISTAGLTLEEYTNLHESGGLVEYLDPAAITELANYSQASTKPAASP